MQPYQKYLIVQRNGGEVRMCGRAWQACDCMTSGLLVGLMAETFFGVDASKFRAAF